MRPLLTTLTTAAIALATPAAHAIEEPKFELLQQSGNFELRRYAPYVVAEVRVPGSFSEAGNQGFRLLANYIFGGNQGRRKLAMTAPVIQAPAEPVKLAMTAPVIQSAASQGGHTVQFVLPADVTLATAPIPNDPQVHLREVPERTLAVMRYSGSWSQRNYDEQLVALRSAADQAGIKLKGEPVLSRFNGPFTLPSLRRNEIWWTVQE